MAQTETLSKQGGNGESRSRLATIGEAVTNVLTYVLLDRFEYAHVQDKNTGTLTLHEGPKRLQLASNEELTGKWEKVRVLERQFAVVLNPFSPTAKDIREGEREVRIGPTVFALHPGERLEGDVQDEFVLTSDDALLVRAVADAPHPLAGVGGLQPDAILKSGEKALLTGPRRYIPTKDIRVQERRLSLSLSETEGVYVQNDDTGEVRLVQGPTDFFLGHRESFWDKHLTEEEEQALGYVDQGIDDESRILVSTPRPRPTAHHAVVVDLEDDEAICLYDGDRLDVQFGPQTIFLGPYVRPKVLFLSGGVPVQPNTLRTATLKLGPDFIRDRLVVRTRDNATLALGVTFRWVFRRDAAHPEKLFALKDFVGFAAQTLSSEIREAAASHTFEKFHAGAATIAKEAIFGTGGTERLFSENGLAIVGVDVEEITPQDPEIATKLSDAIKTNVEIYTRRVQEEAQLESERVLIEGRAKNEKAREELVRLVNLNARTELLAQAERNAEAVAISAKAKADALRVQADAERDAEEQRLLAVTKALDSAGGQAYIELTRAQALKATDKVVVPTDSRLHLGLSGTVVDDT